MKRTAFIISLLLLLGACQEAELPRSGEEAPDFYLEGQWQGAARRWAADQSGYYMRTWAGEDSRGVWNFRGALTREALGCEPCLDEIRIALRSYRTGPAGGPVQIDSALFPGIFPFYLAPAPEDAFVYKVQFFQPQLLPDEASLRWDFGDGSSSDSRDPEHSYPGDQETVDVCLDISDPSGCTSSLCKTLVLNDSACRADFLFEQVEGSSLVFFRSIADGQPPLRFRWNFGDGGRASLGNPAYAFAQPDTYRVCLTVTDAEGCQATQCKDVAAGPDLCPQEFMYLVEKSAVPLPQQYSSVIVSAYDAEGIRYSSALGGQGSASAFEVLEVLPYAPNRAGETVRRLRLRFSCTLWDESGREIRLENMEGYVGLAFP